MSAAPVCRAALAEATRLWPNRNRASDGICADARHPSSSDHADPDRDGFCEAFDLTHDPANGCDAHALVRAAAARRDRRIKYAISQGRIWSAARAGEGWRPYSGENPHTRHAHVSTADAHRDDTSSWWSGFALAPAPPAPTPAQEDDMTPEQAALLQATHDKARDAVNYGVAILEALNQFPETDTVAVDAETVARRVDELLAQRLAT